MNEQNVTEKRLSARKRRFVESYLRCGDARAAAEEAGMAPEAGERLLARPEIQLYRRETEQRLYEELGITQAWVGRRLAEIVERCMQAEPHMTRNPETKQKEPDGVWEFDPSGAIRALHELGTRLAASEDKNGTALRFEDWLAQQDSEGGL